MLSNGVPTALGKTRSRSCQALDGVFQHDAPAPEFNERSAPIEIMPAQSTSFTQARTGGEQEHEEVLMTVAAGFGHEALRLFQAENSWWHAYRMNGRNVLGSGWIEANQSGAFCVSERLAEDCVNLFHSAQRKAAPEFGGQKFIDRGWPAVSIEPPLAELRAVDVDADIALVALGSGDCDLATPFRRASHWSR